MIPTTITSSPIPKLMKLIEHLFHHGKFDEAQNMLVNRENKMKIQIENLKRDRGDSIKFEEKLRGSEREREELKIKMTKLIEEKKVSDDKVYERDKIIFGLKNYVSELKNQILEKDQFVKVNEDKIKVFDMRVEQMKMELEKLLNTGLETEQTIEEMRDKLTEADQMEERLRHKMIEAGQALQEVTRKNFETALTVEIMRRKQSETDKTMKELKNKNVEACQAVEKLTRKNFEANLAIEKLSLQQLEAEKALDVHKKWFENLAPIIKNMGEELDNFLNVKVDDQANVVNSKEKSVTGSGGDEQRLQSGNTHGLKNTDAGNMVDASADMSYTNCYIDRGSRGLSKRGTINLPQTTCTDEKVRNYYSVIQKSPLSKLGHSPQAESNGSHAARDLGLDIEMSAKEQLMHEQGCLHKMPCSSAAAGDINEITDIDDETNPGGAANISDVLANWTEKEKIWKKVDQIPSSNQRSKRNRTDCTDVSLPKRKISTLGSDDNPMSDNILLSTSNPLLRSCKEKDGAACNPQTPMKNFDDFSGTNSSDTESESLSDSCINNIIASLKSQKPGKIFKFPSDMLKAFQEDAELCLNAICALYRQEILASKSTPGLNGGFCHFKAMGGHAIAEYLIDGDPELRPQKSLSKVKQERPDVLGQCQRLATDYYRNLFKIYCNREDPFFI